MAGILLTPGPVSSYTGVQSLSRIFRVSVNKARFLVAAGRLQSDNLGSLVVLDSISKTSHVFIKKPPADIVHELEANSDLCTMQEYKFKFGLPPPAPITLNMQHALVEKGLVPAVYFKKQEKRAGVFNIVE